MLCTKLYSVLHRMHLFSQCQNGMTKDRFEKEFLEIIHLNMVHILMFELNNALRLG